MISMREAIKASTIVMVTLLLAYTLAAGLKPLIVHALAPSPDPNVSGVIGYEKVTLNNGHAIAGIYYPARIIYDPSTPDAGTINGITIVSSKESYYKWPNKLLTVWANSKVEWEVWVKWSHRNMYASDLYKINIAAADLGPDSSISITYTVNAGPYGSISFAGEGPDTTYDTTQYLGTPDDPLDCCPVTGTWMKLGWMKTQWLTAGWSVKQKGFYKLFVNNDYIENYDNTNYYLKIYNQIDLTWAKFEWYPFVGWVFTGYHEVSYRFVIGDDIPSNTDCYLYVDPGTININS